MRPTRIDHHSNGPKPGLTSTRVQVGGMTPPFEITASSLIVNRDLARKTGGGVLPTGLQLVVWTGLQPVGSPWRSVWRPAECHTAVVACCINATEGYNENCGEFKKLHQRNEFMAIQSPRVVQLGDA